MPNKRPSSYISRQLRRPSGLFGRQVMTRALDRANRGLIEHTLAALELHADAPLLDVGFGGGLALALAAKQVTRAPLYGVDFSPDIIARGHRRFRKLIDRGRLTLILADVGDIPLRDQLFDRICTMNTIYFWPEPERAAAELRRVCAPMGRLAVGYTGAAKMAQQAEMAEGFRPYAPEQVEKLLLDAGFDDLSSEVLGPGPNEGEVVTLAKLR